MKYKHENQNADMFMNNDHYELKFSVALFHLNFSSQLGVQFFKVTRSCVDLPPSPSLSMVADF